MSNTTEAALWAFVNDHPRFWLINCALGAWLAFRIFRLSWDGISVLGRISRILALLSCLMFFGSAGATVGLPGNTAFGLFAPTLLLISFIMLVEQMVAQCLKMGKIKSWSALFHRVSPPQPAKAR